MHGSVLQAVGEGQGGYEHELGGYSARGDGESVTYVIGVQFQGRGNYSDEESVMRLDCLQMDDRL